MTRTLLVAAALALSAGPAAASPATPVFGGYITQFIDHWSDFFKKQNGIVMAALGVGAVSLFIITRGKWVK